MSEETSRTILINFFAAYFHEDWPCEAQSPEAVVDEYVRKATPEDVQKLGQAIEFYSQTSPNERELEEKLFKDLGCYFRPSDHGFSAKVWLEAIANQLLRKNKDVSA